jgi:peptide/nickel transport system permease protein
VVLNLDFFLPRLIPGNAADVLAAGYSGVSTQVVQSITARLGLNQPLQVQYWLYLQGVFSSWPPYFGTSYAFYPNSASVLIAVRFPSTLVLIGASFALATLISFVMGMVSSSRRGGKLEHTSMYTSIVLWATPPFWFGLLMIWIFGVILGWFPVFGISNFTSTSFWDYALGVLQHLVLPVVTMTAATLGFQFLILRGAYQEVLKSDYIVAAKARGLKDRLVSTRYVLRNSMLPLISLLGYTISFMISTAVFVEYVFGYNGVGDLLVDGILQRDYPILEAGFFYISLLVIIFSIVGDILLVKLDPRLRS